MTDAKAKTKKRIKAVEDFAEENNLKFFQHEYDGSEFSQKHIGGFSSFF